eukprot:3923652-Prymnesium_polylepis.1
MDSVSRRLVLLRLGERGTNDRLDVGLAALRLQEPLEVAGADEHLGEHVDVVPLTAALDHGRH